MPNQKVLRRDKVRRRIRKNIFGTPESPRMSVFRSNKQIYVQIIDDWVFLKHKMLLRKTKRKLLESRSLKKQLQLVFKK
jgi:ribosomal protein L18